MRMYSLILASLLACSPALAATPIGLAPLQGSKNLDVVATKSITGTCGKTIVEVMGVTDLNPGFYDVDPDAGRVLVRTAAGKELSLGADSGVLSDHNGVACVATSAGNRLLFWSNCSGSACGDNFSFFVLDPERLLFVAPKDPRKGPCDAKCAAQVLGNKLPLKINGE